MGFKDLDFFGFFSYIRRSCVFVKVGLYSYDVFMVVDFMFNMVDV
jgi:hypothetical protein